MAFFVISCLELFKYAAMKKEKIVNVSISLVLVTSFIIAGIFDYYIGKDKRIVKSHRNDHHSVINELFARKIRLGQPVGKLLSRWPPSRYSKHDNYMTLFYVKNNEESDSCCGGYSIYIRITAMENKLVKALAVEGVLSEIEYVFFTNMDQATEDDYWESRLQSITAAR